MDRFHKNEISLLHYLQDSKKNKKLSMHEMLILNKFSRHLQYLFDTYLFQTNTLALHQGKYCVCILYEMQLLLF
jgi:hypothetical protein